MCSLPRRPSRIFLRPDLKIHRAFSYSVWHRPLRGVTHFAFCMLFADVPSVLSSQLVTKLCSVEYCAWHVAQNGSVSVCSGWNALAPWALPACRGPPEEVHSSVALYLPQSNHKASSPYNMKGLRSRPKVISVCSVHLRDLLYAGFLI